MTVFQRLPSGKAAELTIRWYARYGPRLVERVREEFATNGIPLSAQHEAALVAAYAASMAAQEALNKAFWWALVGLCVGVLAVYLTVTLHGPPLVLGAVAVLAVWAYVRSPLRAGGARGFYQEFAKLEKEAEEHLGAP